MSKGNFTHKSILTLTASLGMAMAVSGCTSSAGQLPATATAAFADSAEETLAAHVDKDAPLSASGASLKESDGSVTRGMAPVTFRLDDEEIKVGALGTSMTFKEGKEGDEKSSDGGVYYENDDGGWFTLDGKSVVDVIKGNTAYKYMTPIHGGTTGDNAEKFYAVLGLETPHDVITKKANATYSGEFRVDTYSPDGSNKGKMIGDVALDADFTAAKINGSVTFDPNVEADKLEVELEETDISGNSFTTTFSHDADKTKIDGDFAGKFFGDAGQEAGGTMSFDYEGLDDDKKPEQKVGGGTWTAEEVVAK